MEEFQEILNLVLESRFIHNLKLFFWIVVLVSWLGAISYVAKDSAKRYQKKHYVIIFALLPFFAHLAGLGIYLLIRPARTLAEKAYEAEILSLGQDIFCCPSCGLEIKENFVFCPSCGSEIFEHCPNCQKSVKKDWQFCPYCRNRLSRSRN